MIKFFFHYRQSLTRENGRNARYTGSKATDLCVPILYREHDIDFFLF